LKPIIVICCDSLRFDVLSKEVTPNLLRIAENGVFYNKAMSLGSITPLSMPFLLCGQEFFDEKISIQTRVKEIGYRSKLLTTNFNPVYEFFRYGFDEAVYEPTLTISHANRVKRKVGWFIDEHFPPSVRRLIHRLYTSVLGKPIGYIPADGMFKHAFDMLDDDVFLWVHLMDPHIPYNPIPRGDITNDIIYKANTDLLNAVWLKGTLDDKQVSLIKRLYWMNVQDMDDAIGKFYDKVKDNCIFIVTSDHGDEHGEEGNNFGHKGHRVNDVLRHIPLIISGHGLNGVVEDETEMDLFPHILYKIAGLNLEKRKEKL